jgi:ATP/maltotriose-dependent transcriptional regulator MalT
VEIMHFNDDWARALAEAERTCAGIADATRPEPRSFRFPAGDAYYELGEMHRLRGSWAEAERAYRSAAEYGRHPEPGLALVWLAQGKTKAAAAAIRRALDEAAPEGAGAPLLAAAVEILITAGDIARAGSACDALGAIGNTAITPFLRALAARCRGEVLLARGDVPGAVRELRRSWTTWQELDAPYEAARVRVMLAHAYHEGGDDDAAELERDAARRVFTRLGARHDLARLEEATRAGRGPGAALTPRERQVIALIAAGRTNKAIAAALRISERTVDRHVSNILWKLGVPTRAAATAFAYEHGLVGGRAPQA